MEVTRPQGAASTTQSFDTLSARVVTRSFGVRLGGFGLDYTSRQVVVEPDPQSGTGLRDALAQAKDRAALDGQQATAARVYDAAWSEAAGTTASLQQETPQDHPDPVWRKGLAAYAKARDLLRADVARAKPALAVA